MSSIRLTLKLFRHNLKAASAYLITLCLTVAMYYNFAVLKYNPLVLGDPDAGTTVMVCAMLMSIVMVVVLMAFVWSSSRFFLNQRKKEIGLYALCGVPMGRAARVFVWDALLTGGFALVGGLLLGLLTTKLFLMGAALMIKLERAVPFTLPVPALIETTLVVLGIFGAVALRNALIVRRSRLIELLQGARVHEHPPKRRTLLAVLSVAALAAGYAMSAVQGELMGYIVLLAIPILVLVILGSYWAFEALLPGVLGALTRNKRFFYRGTRMVGISNLWYRLRTNYRNLALTSVLSATAIVTLCVALTMSDYVGAREGKYAQRLVRTYSLTGWIDPDTRPKMEAVLDGQGDAVFERIWIPTTRVADGSTGGPHQAEIVMELSHANEALSRVSMLTNLPMTELSVQPGEALLLSSPNHVISLEDQDDYNRQIGGRELDVRRVPDAWMFGGNAVIIQAYVVPDGWLAQLPDDLKEPRLFLGAQVEEHKAVPAILEAVNTRGDFPSGQAEANRQLTTAGRMLFGTLSYLGLVMFGVFSLLTGCALLFKQISEAVADRLKYQAMLHVGATRGELRRTLGWQVGLSLLLPLLLGFVHAWFAVRVMGHLFQLPTLHHLLAAMGVYAAFVLGLYALAVNRSMQVAT